MAATEQLSSCPVCSASKIQLVAEEPDALFPTELLRLHRCDACGIVFLNPRMTEAAIAQLEDESGVYDLSEDQVEREIEARVGLVRSLSGGANGNPLLDIGCNRGFLLAAAMRLGWHAVGVEISSVAAQSARERTGATVYADLESVHRPDNGFGLIVAWHVLEHTHDPVGFLRRATDLLSQDGVLAIQVPSYDFLDRFRANGQLTSLVCAVHNLYFSESAMRQILRRCDLHPIQITNNRADLMLTVRAGLYGRQHRPWPPWRRR